MWGIAYNNASCHAADWSRGSMPWQTPASTKQNRLGQNEPRQASHPTPTHPFYGQFPPSALHRKATFRPQEEEKKRRTSLANVCRRLFLSTATMSKFKQQDAGCHGCQALSRIDALWFKPQHPWKTHLGGKPPHSPASF